MTADETSPDQTPTTAWDIRAPTARRSLLLCAAGALTGLALAGYSLFTAQGTRLSVAPAEDVALVNGVPLLVSDFVEQLRTSYEVSLSEATSEQRHKVLEDMIREELFVQRGVELNLAVESTEVRSALVSGVEAQAVIDASIVPPSDADLRQIYDRDLAKYSEEGTMQIADWQATTKPALESVSRLRAADGNADAITKLAGLQRSVSINSAGEFYFAAKIHLGDTLFELARSLMDGQVSDPVLVNGTWHVLVMRVNHPPVPMPYSSVQDRLRRDWIKTEAQRQQKRTEQFLRYRADIIVQRGFD